MVDSKKYVLFATKRGFEVVAKVNELKRTKFKKFGLRFAKISYYPSFSIARQTKAFLCDTRKDFEDFCAKFEAEGAEIIELFPEKIEKNEEKAVETERKNGKKSKGK